MDENKPKSNKNIIGVIIFLIIIIILFTTNIKKFVNSSTFESNMNYFEQKLENVWGQYISKPAKYFWDNILFGNLLKVDPTSFDKIFNISAVQQKLGNIDVNTK
jgi:hypothetical protein